jgi:hypothetical protein
MALIAMIVLSAGACGRISLGGIGGGGDSSSYQLRTNRDVYNRGNTGEITVRNVSDRTVEYNLCQRRLERRVGSSWVSAFEWPTAGGACTLEARRLGPDAVVYALFEIPTGVPAGSYRVVFLGLLDEEGRPVPPDRAATGSFDVR